MSVYKLHPQISRTPNLEGQILEKIKTIRFEVPAELYCYKQTRIDKQGFETLVQKLLPSFTFKSKESEISFVVPSFSLEFMTYST